MRIPDSHGPLDSRRPAPSPGTAAPAAHARLGGPAGDAYTPTVAPSHAPGAGSPRRSAEPDGHPPRRSAEPDGHPPRRSEEPGAHAPRTSAATTTELPASTILLAATSASLAGSPAVAAAEAEALRRLAQLEAGNADRARADLDLIRDLQRPDETLGQAITAFEKVRACMRPEADAAARDAFRFVRETLPRQVATEPLPRLEDMFLAILAKTADLPEATSTWDWLRGTLPSPSDLAAHHDGLMRLWSAEPTAYTVRRAFEAVTKARRPDEPLADAIALYEKVAAAVWDTNDRCETMAFLRGPLAATDLGRPVPAAQREAMYIRLLARAGETDEARATWTSLLDSARSGTLEGDFPRLFEGAMTLVAAEGGNVDQGLQALREVLNDRRDSFETRVEAFASLATVLGPSFSEDLREHADAYHFYRSLPPEEAAAFLGIQTATRNLEVSMAVWDRLGEARIAKSEGASLFTSLLDAEKGRTPERHPSNMMGDIREQMEAVIARRRSPESLADTATALQEVRGRLHGDGAARAAAEAFAFMRTSVPDSQRKLYLSMLSYSNREPETRRAWTANARPVGFSTLEDRLAVYLAQPAERWPAMDGALPRVPSLVPPGVDRDRASLALLPVAAVKDGDAAVRTVCAHVDAPSLAPDRPGAPEPPTVPAPPTSPQAPDRTARIEWLSRAMTRAEAPALLDRMVAVCEGTASVPAQNRTALMDSLLEIMPFRPDHFEAAVDLLERVRDLPPAQFDEVAPEIAGLVRILPEAIPGTRDAVVGIMEEVAAAKSPEKASPARLLTRFAELYATTRSVEGALGILRKEARAPGGVSTDGDWIIVGGVRVPRRMAVALGIDLSALLETLSTETLSTETLSKD